MTARARSAVGLRRASIREKSAASQPCRCQYASADLAASRETFHVDGARSAGPLPAKPGGEPLGADLVRHDAAAELGGHGAENPAVDAAGVRLLGAAEDGEVGIDCAAERDGTGGGEADCSHSRELSQIMAHYL